MLRLKRTLASSPIKTNGSNQAKVRLLPEDGTSYPLPGTLEFSEVTVEQTTGSVILRNTFPNPDKLLLPGMFVRAVLEEGVNEKALLVPQRGVTRNPARNAVIYIVGVGGEVEQQVTKATRTVGDNWLVSEGLKAGDRVILEGIQKAPAGTTVKIVPFGGMALTSSDTAQAIATY